jgi:hypothetical protein
MKHRKTHRKDVEPVTSVGWNEVPPRPRHRRNVEADSRPVIVRVVSLHKPKHRAES